MSRIDAIINHHLFISCMEKNLQKEKNREYCKHGLQHCLDVARIAYILNLESKLGLEKEIIYSAALLHDITRWKQYEDAEPHNESVIIPGKKILYDCGFNDMETNFISEAICNHREPQSEKDSLSCILYYADKKSRMCFVCLAKEKCYWSNNKKNHCLFY